MIDVTTGGDTGTTTTGVTVLQMLGDYTHTVLGLCAGYYLLYVRIVTGVDVLVRAGASIDITLGVKFELQAAGVVTIQPAAVYRVQKGTVTTIGALEEINAQTIVTDKITTHTKNITTGTYNIEALNETGSTRVSSYVEYQESGSTSVETWGSQKTISSDQLALTGSTRMALKSGSSQMWLDSTGAKINGRLIELN